MAKFNKSDVPPDETPTISPVEPKTDDKKTDSKPAEDGISGPDLNKPEKLVSIKPRVTERFHVGGKYYVIVANQPIKVPKAVAIILEERNLC